MQVPAPFDYERASSVDQAIGLLNRLGDSSRLIAGGHSLLPMMKLRLANFEYLIDINDLHGELGYIRVEPDEVRMRLAFRPEVGRGHGIPHGGAVFTLLDVTAGAMCAIANGAIGAGVTYVTLQATTQFIGVTHHADLDCVARPVKIGKSITFVDAEISAGGTAVARGSFVFKTTRSAAPGSGAAAGAGSEQG